MRIAMQLLIVESALKMAIVAEAEHPHRVCRLHRSTSLQVAEFLLCQRRSELHGASAKNAMAVEYLPLRIVAHAVHEGRKRIARRSLRRRLATWRTALAGDEVTPDHLESRMTCASYGFHANVEEERRAAPR